MPTDTGIIYLASPYSHPDKAVQLERFDDACKAAADLMRRGMMVFSPIAHTHPIHLQGLPGDWAFWERYDRAFLEVCSSLTVLMLDGWQNSKGVAAEVQIMIAAGKPISYMEPIND